MYIVAHLLLYLVVLRRLPSFRLERTIFLYHMVSALVVTVAALAEALLGSGTTGGGFGVALGSGTLPAFEAAVAVIALHGIYSISFLEVWSLAQGGYSLQIMKLLEDAERRSERVDVEALRAIGAAKQSDRLAGLIGAGLVRARGARVELTAVGRLLAAFFALLAWLICLDDGV